MTQQQLSNGQPEGVVMGQGTADLIAFYGLSTGIVQPTGAAEGTDAATTQTLANACRTALNGVNLMSTVA